MNIDTTTLPALTDTTVWPAEDLDALRIAVLTEQERRARLATVPTQMQDLAAIYQAALGADQKPVPYEAGTLYGPGQTVTYNDGLYRNGAPGPIHDVAPGDAAHPYWVLIPPSGASTPFTAGMHLTPGLIVTNAGHTWRYLGADNPSAPANWAPTVANATWAQVS